MLINLINSILNVYLYCHVLNKCVDLLGAGMAYKLNYYDWLHSHPDVWGGFGIFIQLLRPSQ